MYFLAQPGTITLTLACQMHKACTHRTLGHRLVINFGFNLRKTAPTLPFGFPKWRVGALGIPQSPPFKHGLLRKTLVVGRNVRCSFSVNDILVFQRR